LSAWRHSLLYASRFGKISEPGETLAFLYGIQ
jgi:hypothetical protein